MTEHTCGVLERERRRQQERADRNLVDPVAVLAQERIVRRLYDLPNSWHHPDRAALDQFFAGNPDVQQPNGW
jgi:hypothetical protein